MQLLIVVWIGGAAGEAEAQQQNAAPALPTATETRVVKSAHTGRAYTLSVYLPADYASSEVSYPVLYALDGDTSFDELAAQARHLQRFADLIVVGIGFGEQLPERRTSRFRAYMPEPVDGLPGSGGGDRFLDALATEIVPFVETTFRADPARRTLAGHSLGGFFALYALFARPTLFHRYIAISPSVVISDFSAAREGFSVPDGPRYLALYVGSDENQEGMVGPFDTFSSALAGARYPGLDLTVERLDGQDHASVVLPALERALRVGS